MRRVKRVLAVPLGIVSLGAMLGPLGHALAEPLDPSPAVAADRSERPSARPNEPASPRSREPASPNAIDSASPPGAVDERAPRAEVDRLLADPSASDARAPRAEVDRLLADPSASDERAPSGEVESLLDARFEADERSALLEDSTPALGRTFLEMLLVLGGVCLLAYLLLGKLMPRLLRVPMPLAPRRLLAIVDRLPLDPRRSLLVVKLGEQHFLIGVSEQGMSLLSRLDAGEVKDAIDAARVEPTPAPWPWDALFSGREGSRTGRTWSKEDTP